MSRLSPDSLKVLDCPPSSDESGLSGCTCANEPQLLSEGWHRRYVADMKAAKEAAETYQQLGFEVQVIAPDVQSLKAECAACREVLPNYRIVFTRRK